MTLRRGDAAEAAAAPRNPPTVSTSASAPSMARPGIQAWWISSSVPQTARAPAIVSARSSENRGGPGQATAK